MVADGTGLGLHRGSQQAPEVSRTHQRVRKDLEADSFEKIVQIGAATLGRGSSEPDVLQHAFFILW